MPELEDTGGGCRKGHQKPHSILQSEYDGGICARLSRHSPSGRSGVVLIWAQLNKQMDKNDDHHLLRLKDTFIHRQHLCLVFELLSVNLYELIKQNQFRGLSTTLVRVFAQQLINGLALLGKAKLIHCDLKPENILLKKWVLYTSSTRLANITTASKARS
jgi:serine/threonine protein kinase